ncbi:hypothetical protein [Lentzea aerocolonigenes]|uniref:hypothetical protein n=1 Tax=Lentzea aerocolonigenes TaxID=68170 RepID=UPI0004C2D79D|nr:hypothetical protein [Lentzea aerocolonigenes]MCP2248148.1 hypothetical protein [Lentzea aerocolonigenes]
MTSPNTTMDVEVQIDHGQVYVYGVAPDPERESVLKALDDAHQTRRFVGVADGLVDVLTPVQWNLNAPMRIEVWEAEPPDDDDNWDQVVDVDLDVPDGRLYFEASGGWNPLNFEVPTGRYRARVSSQGYTEAREGAEGLDSYRFRLWPRDQESAPQLRKAWPGWDSMI